MHDLVVFGLNGSQRYAQKVAAFLDVPLSEHVEKYFDDGETYVRSSVNVRGRDVYVIHSLYSDGTQKVAEKFANLLFFIGSLVDASAGRITVVAPYLGFSRQDRKTESRAPITTKYIAKLLEEAGADRVLTMDVHNLSAFQNSFRIPGDNLESKKLIIDYLCGGNDASGVPVEYHVSDPLSDHPDNLAVLSPDSGSASRCKRFRKSLEKRLKQENKIEVVHLDKEREHGGEAKGDTIVGNVKGKRVIIVDDMISTGKTIALCDEAITKAGGELWAVCVTHGLFVGKADEHLAKVKRIIVTDTIPVFQPSMVKLKDRINIIPTVRIIGQAIRRIHDEGGSISDLLQD
jgi:ribose-phosphate pyrophosphokinase